MWSEVVHKLWASLLDCPRESCISDDHDGDTFVAKAKAGITRREVAAFDKAMIEQGEYLHLYKLVHEGYGQMAEFLQGPTDMGARLLFQFRLGCTALAEEHARRSARVRRDNVLSHEQTCPLCRQHPETVVHFLLHCPAHARGQEETPAPDITCLLADRTTQVRRV